MIFKKKHISIIILAILSVYIIQGIYMTLFSRSMVSWTFHIGAISVILCWLMFYLKSNLFKPILGIVLLIGSINLIEFTYYNSTFVFSWTPPGKVYDSIGFQPMVLILLIIYSVFNFRNIASKMNYIFGKSETELQKNEDQLVEKFKRKLENATIPKLEEIINNPDAYQASLVSAARIIKDRKSGHNTA